MPQAVDFISTRVVTVEAEARLADAADAIQARHATHCAVLDGVNGRFVGVVRLADVAHRPGQRIFADLVPSVALPTVPEDAEVSRVVEALQAGGVEEVVVLAGKDRYLGLVTREGLLEWALREQDEARRKLQEEVASREQIIREQTAHLRRALKECERYATFASHDLRTPLRAIEWYAEILLESAASLDATGRGYLDRIRNASRRMDALIEGFLEEGRVEPAAEGAYITDLDQAVAEAMALSERLIAERDAKVLVAGPLHRVQGRPAVLVRIVANLLSNAIKHAPPIRAPLVQIRSVVQGDEIWLSIQDNGAGMPGSYPPNQAGPASKPAAGEPQGLGLLIVERAVNRLGGALALESSPGRGSTFTVRLRRAVSS